ncbi:hypothetical protein VE23_07050 [Paenibacillus sp. D9]|uniref:hypothetical protein n=1 Tax=Paenibacillus sp. D9 TaxID=665792 RepID=UPI00061E4A7C|nr:hypothetical protein [Paenibacillus sp. D9]KKC46950.1 hypothetical protein VE23_07050 [Paenibacillus sp. D9]
MSMKERKLFFTRNGQFSFWEKLNALKFEMLEELYYFVVEKKWTSLYPRNNDEFPSFIYKIYEVGGNQQASLETKVDELFSLVELPKSDFNAYVYHYPGQSLDLVSAEINLNKLKDSVLDFKIEGLEIDIFPYEIMNNHKNVIDIRFTSGRSLYFKQNENIQFLNTEIRFYLEKRMAVVTNFSQYTHNDADKALFINKSIQQVSSYRGANLSPILLSDQSLRELLLLEDTQLPTKLKFEVEGRLKVKIDVSDKSNFNDLVLQDEVKYFYDKFPLTNIRVNLSEVGEKWLSVDGAEGKLMTRAQNIEVCEIDSFVEKLSILIEYDYLNRNYLEDIQNRANHKLITTQSTKNMIIKSCYHDVEIKISDYQKDFTGVFIKLLQNAFFYCINTRLYLKPKATEKTYYALDVKTIGYLARINDVKPEAITNILLSLLELYSEHKDNIKDLMVAIDDLIQSCSGMIDNASGL